MISSLETLSLDSMPSWFEAIGFEVQSLLTVSAIGSLLVVFAWVLQIVLRDRISAHWLYLLWIVVLLRFALFVVPASPTSLLNFVGSPIHSSQPKFLLEPMDNDRMDIEPIKTLGLFESDIAESKTESVLSLDTGEEGRVEFNGWLIAKWIWAIGLLWWGLQLLRQYVQVRSLLRRATSPSSALQIIFEKQKQLLNINRSVSLLLTDEISVPAMTGVLRPQVLIPIWCASELTERELEMVVTHELVHIRRCDGLIQFVTFLINALHWFNPLLRIAVKYAESYREVSCDRVVVELLTQNSLPGTSRVYAETIIKIAGCVLVSKKINPVKPILIGRFLSNDQQLIKQRIAMLFGSGKSRTKTSVSLAFICLATLVAVGFTAAQTTREPAAEIVVTQEPIVEKRAKEQETESIGSLPKAKVANQKARQDDQLARVLPRNPFLDAAKKHLTRSLDQWESLGVIVAPTERVSVGNASFGLHVLRVVPGSPFAIVGLQKSDILYAVDGWKTDSFDDVTVLFDRKVIAEPNSKGITDLRFYLHRLIDKKWQRVATTSPPLLMKSNPIGIAGKIREAIEPTGMIAVENALTEDAAIERPMVAVKIKVYEVSNKKLKELGIDWKLSGEK